MKQTDEAKLERSREILEALKEARGGKLLDSHRVMGNDPNLINMFYQQYVNCNKKDISIPKKYRELIVMAVGIATSMENWLWKTALPLMRSLKLSASCSSPAA